MHHFDEVAAAVDQLTHDFVVDRLRTGSSLGATALPAEVAAAFGVTITPEGLGATEAFRRFTDVVVPATVGLDSPRFLAFVPAAPTVSSILFDSVVSACSFSAESWLEAAGAVHAENEALRFLMDLLGMPASAGGCFVSGGTAGNLAALAAARDAAGRRVAVADSAHSSVASSLHFLDMHEIAVRTGPDGRLTADELLTIDGTDIVVASAGATNAGVIDELGAIADLCEERGWWLHVDGAYGGAARLVPSRRDRFEGVGRADSVIVDPHKWLFGPLDCCALLYRDPATGYAVHHQEASYLDALHVDGAWNPADYAIHLTRRARGLPFWFSLAVHGTDAYARAIERGIELAEETAARIVAMGPPVELILEPELSVVLFRRQGWDADRWLDWSRGLLADGVAFVTPTRWRGESVGRLVFLHPDTDMAVVDEILERLR